MKEDSIARLCKALSDPHRIKIIQKIHEIQTQNRSESPAYCCCIKDIAVHLDITLPTISHHIKELSAAGLISLERKGQCRYCFLQKSAFETLSSFFQSF